MEQNLGLGIQDDTPMQLLESEGQEPPSSLPVLKGKSGKRRRSNLSSDGGEDESCEDISAEVNGIEHANSVTASHDPYQVGLQQQRASTLPQKLDKGAFEPPALQTSVQDGRPPSKKARTENKIEISYDSAGIPRITSLSAKVQDNAQEAHDLQRAEPPATIKSAAEAIASVVLQRPPAAIRDQTKLSSSLLNAIRPSKSKRDFCLIHAICRDNDLLLHFVSFLTIPSLISLYAISKPFHYLFNRHHTAFILACARTWAPGVDTIYPWRCYQSLCSKDPSKLQKKRLENKEDLVGKKWNDLRDVPSLKWLQMVVWRHGICKDILVQLAVKGLRCPPGTLDALKRMWFLMDLPLNAHRIALIQTSDYIAKATLGRMTHFLLKLDMSFTDPIHPNYPFNHPDQLRYPRRHGGGLVSGVLLRKILLEERNLTPLWRVLRGWNWDPTQPQVPMNKLDILRLWVKHRYILPDDAPAEAKKQSIMGIPWYEVGRANIERTGVSFFNLTSEKPIVLAHPSIAGTGQDPRQQQLLYPHGKRIILTNEKPREKLLRPDELVIRECVRRRMGMHKRWALMMLWGFNDEGGNVYPVLTEEEFLRIARGLPARAKVGKKEEVGEEGSGDWSTLPKKEGL